MMDGQMDGGVHNIPIAFKKCGDNFQDFCLIDLNAVVNSINAVVNLNLICQITLN